MYYWWDHSSVKREKKKKKKKKKTTKNPVIWQCENFLLWFLGHSLVLLPGLSSHDTYLLYKVFSYCCCFSFFSSIFPTFVKGWGNVFSVCDLVSTNFVRALTVGYHCLTVSFVYHLYTSHGTNHCILVTMFGWTEFQEKCLVDLKFHRGRLWDEGEDFEHHFASGRKWWLIK